MYWMHPFGGGWFMMLIWWVIIVAVIAVAIRWLSRQRGEQSEEGSAIEILKKRYARGEISREEFEEKKRDLL